MNGTLIKIVIDTNILVMGTYNKESKSGKILQLAAEEKIILYSPISVKTEFEKALRERFELEENKINIVVGSLPVTWIEKELYEPFLEKTKVKHKADKPIEAVALLLNCGILSADEHFKSIKQKIDIDDLLKQIED